MPSGGDRRPLIRRRAEQERRAALLLQAMYRLSDEFASDFDTLYESSDRLIRVLTDYYAIGAGRPRGELRDLPPWIERVQLPVPVTYPPPRPPPEEEEAEYRRRQRVESFLLEQLYRGWPPDRGEPADDPGFIDVINWISRWTLAVFSESSAHLQRQSCRKWVRAYFAEAGRIAERWRLDAWWAVPAILSSHFIRAATGERTPLLLLVEGCDIVNYYPVTVPLPRTRDEYFPLEREYFADLHLIHPLGHDGPADVQVRVRPSGAEMRIVERRLGASTVTVDWVPDREPTPVDRLVAAARDRLGGRLTRRDERELRRLADQQISEIRSTLRQTGEWKPLGMADIESHAVWLAWKLLEPDLTWPEIAARHVLPDLGLPHSDEVRREARGFARDAGLQL